MKIKVTALIPVEKEVEIDDSIVDGYLHKEDEYDAAIERKYSLGIDYDAHAIIDRLNLAHKKFWDALGSSVDGCTIISYNVNGNYIEV